MAFLNAVSKPIIRSVIWSLPALARLLLAGLLSACLLLPGITNGQVKRSDVYAVMAVYTYNFAKFTQWPPASTPTPGSPLNLCLLGEDPFGLSLSQLEGKTVKNHTLHIRRYPRVAVLEDCQIVFVSRSEDWRLDTILRELAQSPILTVSDIPDFARRGGMIAMQVIEQRVRFSINTAAAAQAGLQLSSKLLELAQIVD